jgi:two-component system cell cycle sensor histidine kinase/response regulator CckA
MSQTRRLTYPSAHGSERAVPKSAPIPLPEFSAWGATSSRTGTLAGDPLTWLAIVQAALLAALIGVIVERPDFAAPAQAASAVLALTFTATLLGMAKGIGARRRQRALLATLAKAMGADGQARLLIAADGEAIFRNEAGARMFALAADPCQHFRGRCEGDERTLDELARLATAARHGGVYRTELAFAAPDAGVEWVALSVHPVEGGGTLWVAEDITARRSIEETLRREHEMLADFIDYLPIGFYSADTEGRFRFVNQRLAEWIGRPAEDLVGLDLGDILGAVPDPEEPRAEMRLKGRNGDIFQAFVSHSVFDSGGETLTRSVVVRDLMPEGHRERELKAAERRFSWLFDEAPGGIVLADPDLSISQANPAFIRMVGSSMEEVIGRPITDFIHLKDRPAAIEQLSRVLMGTGGAMRLPARLEAGRGREIVATLHVGATTEEDAITGLVLHFIDTTQQKNLELQFAQSQKMQAMGQLAGGVAHDFNNLLTAMIGFCDLLLQRHGPGDSSFADLMQIKQNANRAASLVRQLLAFSRRQTLQPKLFDVTDALADLSNLLRRLLGETIELQITHGRDLGTVRVDPGQFDQVVINLAVNARDAMPGGGQLSISTHLATVDRPIQAGADTMPPGFYVQIDVVDTGTGMSAETMSRIFEPFFSTKEVGAGTGLGLSTVYGIVRQTDGFIFVDSQPGEGTAFHIFLPRLEAVADKAKPRPSYADSPGVLAGDSVFGGDLTGAGTVLIVEDEDAVRLFGARALRNKGYRVIEANSGEGALDVLRGEEPIDVLVTDVVMPGMDGMTLARLVRMERPAIRVILMSGYAEDIAPGDLSGEDGIHFLPKPFSLKQLAGKVKEAMTLPQ